MRVPRYPLALGAPHPRDVSQVARAARLAAILAELAAADDPQE